MISKVWVINGILAVILVLCIGKTWDVWHEPAGVFPQGLSEPDEKKSRPVKMASETHLDSPAAYGDVVDKNLFATDRMPPQPPPAGAPPEEEAVAEEVRVSGEKVELYGVIMLNTYKKALTNDPSDRSIPYRWIREGEKIGNLSVREINADNILLADVGKMYRILLYDPEKTVKNSSSPNGKNQQDAQPQVVSAGTPPQSSQHSAPAKQGGKVSAPADSEDEFEIVDTPFGKIRRKKR